MSRSDEPADTKLPLSDKELIDRVCLDFEDCTRVSQYVEACADDLWLAANRIGILNTVALEMRGADFAALHELAQYSRYRELSAVPPYILNVVIERRVAAFDCIG